MLGWWEATDIWARKADTRRRPRRLMWPWRQQEVWQKLGLGHVFWQAPVRHVPLLNLTPSSWKKLARLALRASPVFSPDTGQTGQVGCLLPLKCSHLERLTTPCFTLEPFPGDHSSHWPLSSLPAFMWRTRWHWHFIVTVSQSNLRVWERCSEESLYPHLSSRDSVVPCSVLQGFLGARRCCRWALGMSTFLFLLPLFWSPSASQWRYGSYWCWSHLVKRILELWLGGYYLIKLVMRKLVFGDQLYSCDFVESHMLSYGAW
jgi:hypothetical protein